MSVQFEFDTNEDNFNVASESDLCYIIEKKLPRNFCLLLMKALVLFFSAIEGRGESKKKAYQEIFFSVH